MNNITVGDIFVSLWGYDQTNVDFYQVISRTKAMVTVRRIQASRECASYPMASHLMPKKDHFLDSDHPYDQEYGKPMKRKLLEYNGEPYFKPASYSRARLWDGEPKTETCTG